MGLASFNRMRKKQAALRKEMRSEKGIDLSKKTKEELCIIARDIGITGYSKLNKNALIKKIIEVSKYKQNKQPKE